jgi:hypothetical protein
MSRQFDQDFISQEMRETLEEGEPKSKFLTISILLCILFLAFLIGYIIHDIWKELWPRATFLLLVIYGLMTILQELMTSTERTLE